MGWWWSCAHRGDPPALIAQVLVAVEDRHDAILGGELQLLNSPPFELLLVVQMDPLAESFELMLQLQMLLIKSVQFRVMRGVQLDQVLFPALHWSPPACVRLTRDRLRAENPLMAIGRKAAQLPPNDRGRQGQFA